MAVSTRFPRGLRCGDCMFLTALVVLMVIMSALYFKESSDKTSQQEPQQQPGQQIQANSEQGNVWPAGRRMRERIPLDPMKKAQEVMARVGLPALPDSRPPTCLEKYTGEYRDTELHKKVGSDRIGIVILPTEASFNMNTFKTTLVSILGTTAPFYLSIDIGVVTSNVETAKTLRQSFDSLTNTEKPIFKILEREDFFDSPTMFAELLSVAAADFSDCRVVVFVSSGMQCQVGWFEAIVDPFYAETQPAIVSPVFINTPEAEANQLVFNWRLAPQWTKGQPIEDNAKPYSSLMFIPQAFAINRHEEPFGALTSMISQRDISDPTTFDATMYFQRCLGRSVITAPCSMFSLPGNFLSTEFDPFMSPKSAKLRMASTWLAEYRSIFEPILGDWSENLGDSVSKCQSLSSILDGFDKDAIFVVPDTANDKKGYRYIASFAGTTFLPVDGRMKAIHCPFPETPESLFHHSPEQKLESLTNKCLTAPEGDFGYVSVEQCREHDARQVWHFLVSGKLRSEESGYCIMHATDPISPMQVMMMTTCDEDSSFVKFNFARNC